MKTTKILLYTLITFLVLGILGGAAYLIYAQTQKTVVVNQTPMVQNTISTAINYENTTSSLPVFNAQISSSTAPVSSSAQTSSTNPENKEQNQSSSTQNDSSQSSTANTSQGGYLNNNFSNLAVDLPAGWSVVENVVSTNNVGGIDMSVNGLVMKNANGENRLNFTYGIYNGDAGLNKSKTFNMWLQPSEFTVLKNDWVRVKWFDKDSNLDTFVYIPAQNIILKENKAFSNEVAKCDNIRNGRIEGDTEQCQNYKSAGALVNKDSFTYIKTKVKEPIMIDPNKKYLESEELKRFFDSEGLEFVATLTFSGKIVDDADKIVESLTIDLNK